jgi:hypothetical protein
MSSARDLVTLEAAQFRQQQLSRWCFVYSLNVAVRNGETFPAILPIEEDAEFLAISMTGSAYGPCINELGVKALNAETDFPLAGTASPSGANLPAIADRGLSIRITDQGAGRVLTNGFIPVETILTPGYGVSRTVPQPLRYYLLRNSQLQFDIRNRDTATGPEGAPLYHLLSISIYGFKFQVPRE